MEVQIDTLVRSALIALVLVAPYGVHKWRQVRAARQERLASEAALRAEAEPVVAAAHRPRLEDVIASIDELAARAAEGPVTLLVPRGPTVDGRDVDATTVDVVVRDALRRSGLIPVAEVDTAEGRLLELVARVTMNE